MKNKTRLENALHDLYFSLNPDFLNDLKNYTKGRIDELKDSGKISHDYTLSVLIKEFSSRCKNVIDIDSIQELKSCDSIGCMMDFYELIDLMIENI